MKNLILKNLQPRKIFFFFLTATAIYVFMLTTTIPQLMQYSGGLKIPDMIPTGYNHNTINTLMNALGKDGRHYYLFHQMPADLIYPATFAIAYCLLFAYILKVLHKTESVLFCFCYLPLIAGFSDYCENFAVIAILNSFPHNSPQLSWVANLFSVTKSMCTATYFIALILTLIALAVQKSFYKKS